jgi:solute carrier family 35 protein E1
MFSILVVVVLITLLNVNVNAFKICNTKSLIKPMMLQKNNDFLSSKTMLKMSSDIIQTPLTVVAKADTPPSSNNDLMKKLQVGGLFGLWYILNIGYNIYNKKVLNLAPKLTYVTAWLQLAIGILYVVPKWELNKANAPVLTNDEIKNLFPVAICHLLTHVGAIVSLGAGAVSFTHIVKAAEPAVSAALSAIFLNSFLPIPVYLTLLPVMGGVALASLSELSFTWLSFGSAMISNVASASRGIVGKLLMGKSSGKNMNASNIYGVMTILSTIMMIPITLAVEGSTMGSSFKSLIAAGKMKQFAIESLIAGIFYYAYNEVAFLCLDNVAPVTHALGNTIKRVVIIIASVLAFGTKMTSQGILGSSIAIGGVLLYSIAKDYFK